MPYLFFIRMLIIEQIDFQLFYIDLSQNFLYILILIK